MFCHLLFHHELLALMDIDAFGKLIDCFCNLASLQVVDGVIGSPECGDAIDACQDVVLQEIEGNRSIILGDVIQRLVDHGAIELHRVDTDDVR